MHTRVSLVALLVSACGDVGTDAPIVAGPFESASFRSEAPSTATEVPSAVTVPTASSIALDSPTDPDGCIPKLNTEHPIFENLGVSIGTVIGIGVATFPQPNILFSWTTLEQAQELAAAGPLLSRSERPGKGPGFALEYLASFVSPTPEGQELASLLLSEPFSKARYAWPQAWATRMGWPANDELPAETYGNQLLRIVVRSGALWAAFYNGQLSVVDETGAMVPTSDALAQPERIVGMYFQKDSSNGGAACGSFGRESDAGFREFIIMNPDMVESWSLGTEQIRQAVNADLERLRRFFQVVRACPTTSTVDDWTTEVICSNWNREPTELGAYEQALALMNAYYVPRPAEIAAIVATLEADLEAWELVVGETTEDADSTSSDDPGSTSSQNSTHATDSTQSTHSTQTQVSDTVSNTAPTSTL